MQKDFDAWNSSKKKIDSKAVNTAFYEREIWWCKLGHNIGIEINGKHELFLRPIIVIRKFNKDMLLGIPTTSNCKNSKYYCKVSEKESFYYNACISQIRVLSSKRLFRKIDTISKHDYMKLIKTLCEILQEGL